MDILEFVLLACCIWSNVQGINLYEEESQHSNHWDRLCVDCADISDLYRRECRCRTYTFAFTDTLGLAHWDEKTNQPAGPRVEVVRKVCELANRDCDLVFIERGLCWDGQVSPVLNGRWFDACAGPKGDSQNRHRLYSFPKYGFMPFGNIILLARPGSNITQEMLRNTSNDFTLAFFGDPGRALDAFFKAGFFIKPLNLINIFGTRASASTILLDMISDTGCDDEEASNGEPQKADLILHLGAAIPPTGTAEDYTFVAEFDGLPMVQSLMFRRDDRCLMSWWDEAYEAFICSDGYLDFCQGLNAAGGHRWDICQNQTMCATM